MQKTDEKKREKVNGVKIPAPPGPSAAISCGLRFERPAVAPCAPSAGQRGRHKGVLRLGGEEGDI